MAKNIEKEEKNEMSIEMLKACKNDIAKFGFNLQDYAKFLISVHAMKDEHTVLQFPNEEMEQYCFKEFYLKNPKFWWNVVTNPSEWKSVIKDGFGMLGFLTK